MHQAGSRIGDEVDEPDRREVAIELGEGTEGAPADPGAGERTARRGVKAFEIRHRRRGRPRVEADTGLRGHDQQRFEPWNDGADPGGETVELNLDVVGRGDHLEGERDAEPVGQFRRTGRDRGPIGRAKVDGRIDELHAESAKRIGAGKARADSGDRDAQPDPGHGAGIGRGEVDLRLLPRRPHGSRGHGATERDRDRLAEGLAGREHVGIGQAQGPDIGLERSVQPVAVILRLPGVTLHADGRPEVAGDPMAQGADVREARLRIDVARKAHSPFIAVHVGDMDRLAGDALQRMQHDEAGTIGPDVIGGRGARLESDGAVGRSLDPRLPGEIAIGSAATGVERHDESVVVRFDAQVLDDGRRRVPDPVADEEGDAAEHFDAAIADPAQRARFQRGDDRPCHQQ